MKPPICELCGRRARETVRFADYEPLPHGMTGHPTGLAWVCGLHLRTARALAGGSLGDALRIYRRRWWIRFHAVFFLLVGASAAVAIWAHYAGAQKQWLVFLFKPLTTVLIFTLAARPRSIALPDYRTPILIGLAFSLLGDVFLMFSERWFLLGLLSFAVTHVFYIRAFKSDVRLGAKLPPFVVMGALAAGLTVVLWPGLDGALRLAVPLYAGLVAFMAAQATARAGSLGRLSATVAAFGAVLFLLSDATLAVDRFRFPFEASRAVVLSTYWLGQWLIALSVELFHRE